VRLKLKKIINKNSCLLYCAIYTITTILNSIIYLCQGLRDDPSGNWHELDRALIILIGVLALQLYKKMEFKNKFLNIICAYIPTMLLTFLYVFFRGFRENLAKSAYKDIFVNYTLLFGVVVTIDIIAEKIRNKRR
jgi:hypothetical protein